MIVIDVKKRNGDIVPFNFHKIENAVKSAFDELNEPLPQYVLDNLLDGVELEFGNQEVVDVEQIQDYVEDMLLGMDFWEVAKAYIKYRRDHEVARQKKFDKQIEEKLFASNVVNQNANVDEHSFGGRMGETTEVLTKQYALDHCMSKMARENHLNNEIYIHDLGHYAVGDHNCLSIPFDDLLAKGFNTRQTDVRPANSINTAFQLVAVIFQLQSLNQFGGTSATHLDWTMVPYVRKSFFKHFKDGLRWCEPTDGAEQRAKYLKNGYWNDQLSIEDEKYKECQNAYRYAKAQTEKETHQAIEGMYHNLNTLQSRSGNQLPFTSINFGTCTLPEGRLVIDELLTVSIEGVGRVHKTAIFPCSIFQLGKGINRKPEDPNYDLFIKALKSTAQRLYPNYANIDWSGNEGYDPQDPTTYFSTMGK